MVEYCYYIEDDSERINYYITDTSDELKQIKKLDKSNKATKWFECYGKIYDDNLQIIEKLKLFRKDYNQWSDEIKDLYDAEIYDYFNPKDYGSNNAMVMCLFLKYTKKLINKYDPKPIGNFEASYQERTHNGGITYLSERGLYDCYGYDFSGYYQNILGNEKLDFYLPIREGKQKHYTIEKLFEIYKNSRHSKYYEKIPFGYYDVKITSEHNDAKKVFCFSDKDCYTHLSLSFCIQYRVLYKFKFEMANKEFNAYIYEQKDIVKSSTIFNDWFRIIKSWKEKLPKNKIVKHLSSSLWGQLIRFNRQFITIDELLERNDVSRDINDDEATYYIKEYKSDKSIEIIDKNCMYKNNLARIKSFLTAFSRDYIGRMIIKEKIHDKIVRIYTDGLVLTEQHNFEGDYVPIVDSKTTGKIFWNSISTYYYQCQECNRFYNHNKSICPDCN